MDRRTHEGPMDFEYQNGTGPMDGRSPFAQVSGNQRSWAPMDIDPVNKKRGIRSAFGSPSKPDHPSLRPPHDSQPHLFSQPTKPPSPTKSFSSSSFSLKPNPLFSTPRKLDADLASSGGETPQSPSHDQSILDSDATPDNNALNFRGVQAKFDQATMPTFTAGCTASPTKLKTKELERVKSDDKRRDSWWSRAAGLVSLSPATHNNHAAGRGEIAKGDKSVYSDKIVKKVQKKRRGDAVRQLVRMKKESVSESEDSRPPSPSKSKRKWGRSKKVGELEDSGSGNDGAQGGRGAWWNVAEFLTQHPTLPQILSWYAQLTLNTFLVGGLIYLLWSFYSTIRSDIDKKSTEAISELLAEMALCAKQYTDNRCAPESRVPAMETVCLNWEKCMKQDPRALSRARISVGMWAEIFNGFIEPISWKAMIFTVVMVFGCVALSNLPFSMIRHKADQAAANHHHYYGNTVPPTPSRQFSNPGDLNGGYWTPHQQNLGLEPAPSQGYGQIEGRESPVKRLQFR